MTRGEFLGELRAGLTGLRQQDIEDIIVDYESHFADGKAAGRSENQAVPGPPDVSGEPQNY